MSVLWGDLSGVGKLASRVLHCAYLMAATPIGTWSCPPLKAWRSTGLAVACAGRVRRQCSAGLSPRPHCTHETHHDPPSRSPLPRRRSHPPSPKRNWLRHSPPSLRLRRKRRDRNRKSGRKRKSDSPYVVKRARMPMPCRKRTAPAASSRTARAIHHADAAHPAETTEFQGSKRFIAILLRPLSSIL